MIDPAALEAEMTAWRRDLHQHREFGFEEHRTEAFVAKKRAASHSSATERYQHCFTARPMISTMQLWNMAAAFFVAIALNVCQVLNSNRLLTFLAA